MTADDDLRAAERKYIENPHDSEAAIRFNAACVRAGVPPYFLISWPAPPQKWSEPAPHPSFPGTTKAQRARQKTHENVRRRPPRRLP